MALELKLYGESTWFGDEVDGWRVTYRMHRRADGTLVIGAMNIRPTPALSSRPDHSTWNLQPLRSDVLGITQDVLRKLNLRTLQRYGRAVIEAQAPDPPQSAVPGRGRALEYPIAFYRKIGKQWDQLVKRGDRAPAKSLAVRHGMTRGAMRSFLARYDEHAKKGRVPVRGNCTLGVHGKRAREV